MAFLSFYGFTEDGQFYGIFLGKCICNLVCRDDGSYFESTGYDICNSGSRSVNSGRKSLLYDGMPDAKEFWHGKRKSGRDSVDSACNSTWNHGGHYRFGHYIFVTQKAKDW